LGCTPPIKKKKTHPPDPFLQVKEIFEAALCQPWIRVYSIASEISTRALNSAGYE
jgi:hypothetical protein